MAVYQFLSKKDIIYINKRVIERYKGDFTEPYNLNNVNALDYLVEAVKVDEMFGVPRYPTISHKTALYVYNINDNHIFNDGNKRTSLAVMDAFLKMNNHQLKRKLQILCKEIDGNIQFIPKAKNSTNSKSILESFILEIASGKLSYDYIFEFLNVNIEKINN